MAHDYHIYIYQLASTNTVQYQTEKDKDMNGYSFGFTADVSIYILRSDRFWYTPNRSFRTAYMV
jgi:hypothetical protein